MVRASGTQGDSDVWLLDLARNGLALAFHCSTRPSTGNPFWSPDGDRIVFSSTRKAMPIYIKKRSSGAGSEDVLLADKGDKFADELVARWAVSVVHENARDSGDMWVLPMAGDGKPFPFLQTPANEIRGSFRRTVAGSRTSPTNPDGRKCYVSAIQRLGRSRPEEDGRFHDRRRYAALAPGRAKRSFYVSPPPDGP